MKLLTAFLTNKVAQITGRFFLLVLLLFTGATNSIGQTGIDTSSLDTEATYEKKNSFKSVFYGQPGKAALYSLIAPGGGQLYNKRWWKVPLVWAGEGFLVYNLVQSIDNFKSWEACRVGFLDPDVTPVCDPIRNSLGMEVVKSELQSTDPQLETIEIPEAVDISEKVDLSKGEGNVRAEIENNNSLPEIEDPSITIEDPIVETPKAMAEATTTSNAAVEEWIRPGASQYQEPNSKVDELKKRYSPEYSGYKVVVIFSRFELPKEHNIFSKYADVDVYTTADGNKLYMVGAFDSKKEAYAHMNSTLKKPYPHSYVVGFENGIRIY